MGGVNEKWSLRYVVGPRSIPGTDEYYCDAVCAFCSPRETCPTGPSSVVGGPGK